MDLNYIERKIEDIYRIRAQILKEMNVDGSVYNDSDKGLSFITKKFKRSFFRLKDMKIACIMDEFTYHSFKPECNILQITPQNWLEEMERFKPDLFFLESAWRGYHNLWNMKVAYLSDELIEIFSYCKKNEIPIVFWNKEDPVHFSTFINLAKYVDFVFTTDIDCIKSYKTILNHERVYLMPFAAQMKYHNPVEIEERKDKFCFAGAYYKKFQDRVRDLETFVNTITSMKDLDIYDRNYYNQDPQYAFPRSYKRYIVGNLKPEEIDRAYKGYRFNINMNTVKQSQSMCARRIFELLASNTVTVSNYSKAIRNLFGDLVVCTDDGKRLYDEIKKYDDPEQYSKFRLSGLRKVLAEHTYRKRLSFMVNKVYENPLKDKAKQVAVIACVNTNEEMERIIRQYKRQVYEDKKLFILADFFGSDVSSDDIQLINGLTDEIIETIQCQYEYWTFFSASDYYGKNYIYDLVLALKYTEQPVISKSAYFAQCDGSIDRIEEGHPYRAIDNARIRKAFIRVNHFSCKALIEFAKSIDEGIILAQCMSIDEYNYCMNYTGDECTTVDDLPLSDTGISMDNIHEIVEKIKVRNINSEIIGNIEPDTGCYVNKSNVLLITDNYPNYQDLYRYAFIHSRLIEYRKRGQVVDVFKYSERYPKGYSEFGGIDITCGYFEEMNDVLMYGSYDTILIHFLSETIWNGIKNSVKGKKIIVWIHGAEIQSWWRREHNYTTKQQLENAKRDSEKRLNFWREIFNLALDESDYDFHFVFVSDYLANGAFEDTQIALPDKKYSIIHNYINSDLFNYIEKKVDLRKKVLSIRPFANHNYANDLTVKAILELAKDPIFKDLEFRIIGKGELFHSTVKPLRKYKNVILEEKFLRQEEIAALHKEYGVFIVPTRMDSQGVSRDEAMSSGLVPVTNNVAAIPEFVDQGCGMLVEAEDYMGLAKSIKKLYDEPELFQRLSRNAADRVRRQSGINSTVEKEIELINSQIVLDGE